MYAMVNQVELQPGKADEGLRTWRETFLPRLKQQRGFKGLILLLNRAENRGMSVLLWESEADAQVVQTGEVGERMRETVRQFLAGPPSTRGYEVMMHEDV